MSDPSNPTANVNLGLLVSGLAGAEVLVNDSLLRLDTLIGLGVQEFDKTGTIPASPSNGESWKIGNSSLPTEWTGKEDQIAIYYGGWLFVPPTKGMILYDINGDTLYMCTDPATDAWDIMGREGSAVASLTDSSTGSTDGTLSATADTSSSDQSGVINDNFAELAEKIDDLLIELRSKNIIST